MNQESLILESSAAYILVCLLLAVGFAWLLYQKKHPWSKSWNRMLFAVRTLLAFFLMFLLLGPIVKQINNLLEKPVFVLLYDTSASVAETTDSTQLNALKQGLQDTRALLVDKGFDVKEITLDGNEVDQLVFDRTSTDITAGLRRISNRFEGRRVAGVILPTDGLYNTGLSPLFSNYNFPVSTVGLGDTTERTDLSIKNIAYNKVAYQGNKFPIRAEILAKNVQGQDVKVRLKSRGKVLQEQTLEVGSDPLLIFNFEPLAHEQGIQKFDLEVQPVAQETNTRNNSRSVFVEVVEGKKKILVIASTPHPDIKALREVISKNANYEFLLHIPGAAEAASLKSEEIDLAILHQVPDIHGKTDALLQRFLNSKTSLLFILGQQTNLVQLTKMQLPFRYEALPRDYDQVTPVANPAFPNFDLSPEATAVMAGYPPASVHFGKLTAPLSATPLLYQRVGNVSTEKPLLTVDVQEGRKIAAMLGEGLWRWRLNEYDRTENTAAFDEVFGKLIQFLSTTDDRRKFRSYTIEQEFADNQPVVFESQVYNDLYEPVYGNKIDIVLTDEQGKKQSYNYVISPGNVRYQIGGLPEGVYRYRSSTNINGKTEVVNGEFAVVEKESELQNLTADHALLRKLSHNTGGRFYNLNELSTLQNDLEVVKAEAVIQTEESYDSLINLKLVFWILLAFVTLEWFVRKFYGGY